MFFLKLVYRMTMDNKVLFKNHFFSLYLLKIMRLLKHIYIQQKFKTTIII